MQLTIFHMLSECSYRQKKGFDNPPPGTILRVKYMEGVKWYLLWEECPDGESIVEGWINSAHKAFEYAKQNQWIAYL